MTPQAGFHSGLALLVVTLGVMAAVRSRIIRRRLLFSFVLLLGLVVLHITIASVPAFDSFAPRSQKIEQLLLALAAINALVTIVFNSWFKDRTPDRAPAIVQDAVVLALFAIVATFAFKESSLALTGSAITAAVIGFALQETLGNAFAGLAIQVDKPFRVGHWITVANHEGLVTAVTWRATKMRTKFGNLVIIPNNVMAREAITNYSEPIAPTRLFVEVGAGYHMPPNQAREAIFAAMRQVPRVLRTPEPDVLLEDFGGSAIVYRARFWIEDFAWAEQGRDEVRRAITHEFARRDIEIPWPIQVRYHRHEPPHDPPERREQFMKTIAAVSALAPLAADAHRALAQAAEERLYGDGEVVVREGDPGGSMFIVCLGRVVITIGADGREVAVTEAGGYFGEMSLLTGEPRTATVTARGDCVVLEISADAFRAYVKGHPQVLDELADGAAKRRQALDHTRAAAGRQAPVESAQLVELMRKFFGLT